MVDLYGLLVLKIFGYGASWSGHFLDFITMKALGPLIIEEDCSKNFNKELMDRLHLLNVQKVYHGNLNLENILFVMKLLSFAFKFFKKRCPQQASYPYVCLKSL